MAQSKIKVKIVEFINNLLPSKPTQYKPALQHSTPSASPQPSPSGEGDQTIYQKSNFNCEVTV